jgi:chromosomal replication initiation ATPase DnaA
MEQLHIPLGSLTDFSKYSFYHSKSNEAAFSLVVKWPNWEFPMYVITGPKGYGKTHLAHIITEVSKGIFLNANELSEDSIANMEKSTYVIDDYTKGDPVRLFHFYNQCIQTKSKAVFLGDVSPQVLDFGLPDLNSRLRSLIQISLQMPDDELCLMVMKKHFSDLQVDVSEDVVRFLLNHSSRDLGDVQNLIYSLNSKALSYKRAITVPFIKEILADVS